MALLPGGGHAELVAVHESHTLAVPEHLTWPQAGGFVEAFATAHDALFTQAQLQPGERLLVNGAAGGVGVAAVQLGVAAGAHVTGTARHHQAELQALGAETEPSGEYDVILELVGGPNLAANLDQLAPQGRIAVIGTGAGARAEIDFQRLMVKRGRIHASTLRSRSREEKADVIRPPARGRAAAARRRARQGAGRGDVSARPGAGGLRPLRRGRQVRQDRHRPVGGRYDRPMDVDIAVLGGGPGGYTAAIRAAQLGAKVACIEKEPELGGTCLRVGCIPTKAWVQTAHFLHQANDTFAKLGVKVDQPQLDFAAANEWKAGVVKQMTGGVASLFKANGVEWVKGVGKFKDANTIAVEGGEDVTFKSAIVATGSFPLRPPIPGLESDLCVDSTGLLAQTEVPKRLVILGGGIIGAEFASIFNRFGSEVTIIEMLDTLIPQEDADAAKELAKAFGKRGITLQLGKQCTQVEQKGNALTVTSATARRSTAT